MADLATLQTRLTQAEDALHDLLLGNKVVEIRVKGRWMQKTPADIPQLRAYVNELKAQINRLQGGSSPKSPISLHAS